VRVELGGRIIARRVPRWAKHWARDSALLLASQVSAVVTTSVLAILIARSLGPSDWGIFSGFLGLTLALSIVANFGVGAWLLRELSALWADGGIAAEASRASAGRLVSGGVVLNSTLGGALVVGTLAVVAAARFDLGTAIALVSLMVYGALLAAAAALEAYFRSRRELRVVVVAVLLEKLVLLALVALAVALGFGVTGIAVMYAAAGVSRIGYYGVKLLAGSDVTLERPRLSSLARTGVQSLPFALNAASLNIIPRFDTFILVAFSTTAAGYFATGDRVLGPAVMIPWVMSSALYPFLASETASSRTGRRILLLFVVVGSAIAAVGVALAPVLIPAVFGSSYREAVPVVQVMLLAIPFIYGTNALLPQLYTRKRERAVLAASIGTSALGSVAIVVGQVTAGPEGAASGYVLRQAFFLVGLGAVMFWPLRRRGHSRAGLMDAAGRPAAYATADGHPQAAEERPGTSSVS
jgi:O-antigen/teichoic acid export membrane protein